MMNNPKKQTGKKSKAGYLILVSVLLMLVSAFLIFLYGKKKQNNTTTGTGSEPEPEPNRSEPEPEPEPDDLQEFALELVEIFTDAGLQEKEAKMWVSVSAHETGGFASAVYDNNNNLFGMKQPTERDTTSIGQKSNYASYPDDEASVKDILLWIKAKEFKTDHGTIRQLTSDMKNKGYFEAPYLEYTNGVLKWHKRLFNS